MTSGLEFPSHEHEKMFFENDHMKYALNIGLESKPGAKFEYNNVNSMLIGEILRMRLAKRQKLLLTKEYLVRLVWITLLHGRIALVTLLLIVA